MIRFVAVAMLTMLMAANCQNEPIGLPTAPVAVLDLARFQQDRPIIGGHWYSLEAGNERTPNDEQYLVRTANGDVFGLRVMSVDSVDDDDQPWGTFRFEVFSWDGVGFGAPRTLVAPDNINSRSPLCLRLVDGGEVSCAEGHDLRLSAQASLNTLAAITIDEAALYFDEGVDVAVIPAAAPLPMPDTVLPLDDVDAAFDTTDWDFGLWSPNQPHAGLALGRLNGDNPRVVGDDTWFVVGHDFVLSRLRMARVSEGLELRIARATMSRTELAPTTFSDEEVVLVPPGSNGVQWLDLNSDDALLVDVPPTARWPITPPDARSFDIAWVTTDDHESLYLSSAVVVLNATRLGLDEDTAPMTTPDAASFQR